MPLKLELLEELGSAGVSSFCGMRSVDEDRQPRLKCDNGHRVMASGMGLSEALMMAQVVRYRPITIPCRRDPYRRRSWWHPIGRLRSRSGWGAGDSGAGAAAEVLAGKADSDRALADRRGYSFDRAAAHVADGEHSRQAGFEQVGISA